MGSTFFIKRKASHRAIAVGASLAALLLLLFFGKSIFAFAAVDRDRAERTDTANQDTINVSATTSIDSTSSDPLLTNSITTTDASSSSTTDNNVALPLETGADLTGAATSTAETVAMPEKAKLQDSDDVVKAFLKKSHEGLSVESYVDTGFSDDESASTSTTADISDIKIYFYITNDSQQRSLLTLNTGIRKESVNYLRIKGATGYRWENDELVLGDISLPPNGVSMVTITGRPLISDKKQQFDITPIFKDENGSVIASGTLNSKSVKPKSTNFVKGFGMSFSQAETTPVNDIASVIGTSTGTGSGSEALHSEQVSSSTERVAQ